MSWWCRRPGSPSRRLAWRYKTGVPVMTKKNESLSSRISSHLIKTMTHWHHFHLFGCPSHCPISTYCIKSCHICCHCITSERLLSVLTHKLYKSASIWQNQEIQMYCHKEIALMWITLQYFLLFFSGTKIHIFHYIAKTNTDMSEFLAIFSAWIHLLYRFFDKIDAIIILNAMDLVGGSKMVGCDWMWVSKDLKLVAHVSQQLQFATLFSLPSLKIAK